MGPGPRLGEPVVAELLLAQLERARAGPRGRERARAEEGGGVGGHPGLPQPEVKEDRSRDPFESR